MLKQKTRNVEIIKNNTTVEREHLLYFKILIFITNTKFMDIPISKSQTVSIGLKKKKKGALSLHRYSGETDIVI